MKAIFVCLVALFFGLAGFNHLFHPERFRREVERLEKTTDLPRSKYPPSYFLMFRVGGLLMMMVGVLLLYFYFVRS